MENPIKKYYEITSLDCFRSTFEVNKLDGFLDDEGKFYRKLKNVSFEDLAKSLLTSNQELQFIFQEEYKNANILSFFIEKRNIMIKDKRLYYGSFGFGVKQIAKLSPQILYQKNGYWGYLIPNKPETLSEIKEWEISEVKRKSSYYNEWENQFHSPSGCERRGYRRWKILANKYDIT